MRVLWIVNFVLPIIADEFRKKTTLSGGWVVALAEDLAKIDDIHLGIAMPADVSAVQESVVNGTTCYLLPSNHKNRRDFCSKDCQWVLEQFKPDIVHAHGTEFVRVKTFLDMWHGKTVVSIQGLRTGIKPYIHGGLNIVSMLLSGNPSKIFPAILMSIQKYLNYKESQLDSERAIIRQSQAVMGRTQWDNAHVLAINPKLTYYHANESLRGAFYSAEWSLQNKTQHSILKVAASAPLKGLHILLEAVALLKEKYHDIILYVIEKPPVPTSVRDLKTRFGYPMYLRYLIQKHKLQPHVVFLGTMNESQIVERMLKTHVFVLSSSIENSPNTLGEAMLLGVPSVASYVGGVPNLVMDEKEALLYRYDDPILLAHQISRIFDNDDLAISLSSKGRSRALNNYDRKANVGNLLHIYADIFESSQFPCGAAL